MTALLAIRAAGGIYDAYALTEADSWSMGGPSGAFGEPVQIAMAHLCTVVNNIDGHGGAQEVSFDSSLIYGTWPITGGSGILIGIWLNSSPSVIGPIGTSGRIGAIRGDPPNFDPSRYVVPAAAGDLGRMYRRGRVSPPQGPGYYL
jgi:hypothetical protein